MRRAVKFISWLLPHGLYVLRKKLREPAPALSLVSDAVLEKNARIRNRHLGKRCFILGNGPSAATLDLATLKDEIVFSVSNGYLHTGYRQASPRYHCLPQITYGKMTREDSIKWLTEMHAEIGDAELFLNETEAALVKENHLFPDRNVHYVAFRESFDELKSRSIIDISKPIPRVESVPLMTLMIAMYMGFTEIILLGVDHDHFKSGEYKYAFKLKTQEGKDYSVDKDNQITSSRHDDFQSLARLWRQYRVIREIADTNQIQIFNGSAGGELDEFPRLDLRKILGREYEKI